MALPVRQGIKWAATLWVHAHGFRPEMYFRRHVPRVRPVGRGSRSVISAGLMYSIFGRHVCPDTAFTCVDDSLSPTRHETAHASRARIPDGM